MLIRTEAPADILPIDRLLKQAFPTDAEANLTMALRENGRFTLSLVACNDEGELVGHALFTPVTVDGDDSGWQGLAPVAVRESARGNQLGHALIKEGLETLAELGYPVCVVLGSPDYYGKSGFVSADDHQLRCQWDVPTGVFQVQELHQGAVSKHQGLVEYSPEFDSL